MKPKFTAILSFYFKCNTRYFFNNAEKFFNMFPAVLIGLGRLGEECRIKLEPNAKLFCLASPTRIAIPLQKEVNEELCRMVELGVIQSVTKPTE